LGSEPCQLWDDVLRGVARGAHEFEKMGAYGVAEQVQDRELATLGGAKRMGESIAE
jgi:hypothetical protein